MHRKAAPTAFDRQIHGTNGMSKCSGSQTALERVRRLVPPQEGESIVPTAEEAQARDGRAKERERTIKAEDIFDSLGAGRGTSGRVDETVNILKQSTSWVLFAKTESLSIIPVKSCVSELLLCWKWSDKNIIMILAVVCSFVVPSCFLVRSESFQKPLEVFLVQSNILDIC